MNIGTTGTSWITHSLIKAFKEVGINVVATYSRDIFKAKTLASEYDILKSYDNYDLMLEDRAIDTIYIALPNALHYEYAKKALLAHKNVIVEKPLTSNALEAKELRELAIKSHLYIFEAAMTMYLPSVDLLRDEIEKIKPLRMVNLNFSKYSSKYDDFLNGLNPNVFSHDMAGGALFDLNIYNVHLTYKLFGKPKLIKYFANVQRDIDTSGIIVMLYDGFIVNAVACKDACAISKSQFMGENGYIELNQEASKFNEYHVVLKNGETKDVMCGQRSAYYYEMKRIKEIYDSKDYDLYLNYLNHSINVMEIIDKINTTL